MGTSGTWTCSTYDASYDGAQTQCLANDDTSSWALRGGAWTNSSNRARSASRNAGTASSWSQALGFRLAQDSL
ncbi:SUMF1/EgtB/PvdO family nonheme iron enzyme [Thiohalocapsa marina]|uniref:SUMF1/EgtB/PvdO family nonheme iron enzyme n=1 Tax=Thiohalocapsa marina TaxID=424902 RepID=UPI003CCC62A7